MTDALGNAPVDGTDRRLLALLRENARAPVTELARKLGLSRTTVQSRIERLERLKVIAGYSVRVAEDYEQGLIKAHIMVTLRPKFSARVEAALRAMPEVRTLHAVSGSFDMIAIAAARNTAEMNVVIDRIGALDGVERTTSAIVLSTGIDR
jgi:DNA-binding Lrp family transcriptional regulator